MTEAAPTPQHPGPLRLDAEVLAVRRSGPYRQLTLAADGLAERFRPGNVLSVRVGGETSGLLARRSLWIHRVRPTGTWGGTVEVVVEPTGPGSRWLGELGEGDVVPVVGPLGRPFALPKEPVTCVLAGHGRGTAPLVPLAERLRERGCVVHLLASADDEAHLFGALDLRRVARSVTVATGDGSVGVRGGIADALPALLDRTGADVVYGCAPLTDLHALAAEAEARGAWSQTALEVPAPCGTGLCHGCPVPVVAPHGGTRIVRGCHEGPVFRGDRVRWDELVEAP
jgi:dihydroorotate dehydrogenase electron transfer subunit